MEEDSPRLGAQDSFDRSGAGAVEELGIGPERPPRRIEDLHRVVLAAAHDLHLAVRQHSQGGQHTRHLHRAVDRRKTQRRGIKEFGRAQSLVVLPHSTHDQYLAALQKHGRVKHTGHAQERAEGGETLRSGIEQFGAPGCITADDQQFAIR